MSVSIFKTAGALTDDHSDIYIERRADYDALAHLQRMDYLLAIEPRQLGKTSLINHLMCHPGLENLAFVYLDVTTPDRSSETVWYQSLCPRILRQLRSFIPRDRRPSIPDNSIGWREFLYNIAVSATDAHKRVVIALDEIGAVTFPGTTAFFSVLRDIYGSRQAEAELRNLTFLLAGAFHPRDLITDRRISPFNIAQRVRLHDFTLQQVQELVNKGPWSREHTITLAKRIHYWAEGQPYLTQLLCSYLEVDADSQDIDAAIESLRREDENHLPPMVDRLQSNEKLCKYVARIISGKKIKFYPRQNRKQADLELLGVIKEDQDGFCAVRNRIYEQVLSQVLECLDNSDMNLSNSTENEGTMNEKQRKPHDVTQIRRSLSTTDKMIPGYKCFGMEIRIHALDTDGGAYAVEANLGNGGHFTGDELRLNTEALREAALDPQTVGQQLADALFVGPIRDAYLKAATYAETLAENCLRLRLWIDPDAAELHALPWELLRVNDVMVSANAATPFSRYLPATTPWETDITARPLRVLAAISNPADLAEYGLSPVKVEGERALLEKALADQDVQLDFLEPPVTLPSLEAKLRDGYHVLHYVGHGAVGKEQQQSVLYLQQEDETTALVKGRRIGAMLARQGVRPHLVVLAACESATVATEDAYVALGPQLIQRGVPAVVAMRGKISQASARTFSRTLYERLLAHGVVDLAMNEARSTLVTAECPDAAVPVLFMRLKDGRLWQRGKESQEPPEQWSGSPQNVASTSPAPAAQTTINITGDGNVVGDYSSSQVVKSRPSSVPTSAQPHTAALRRRLHQLDSVEIESLCMDHFPRVYNKFSRGLRRDEMINLLLAHCRRHPEDAARLNALL